MNVILFGATGMVGQGVLRECLLDPEVALVRAMGRTPTGAQNAKLEEVVRTDLFHYADVEPQLTGLNACFFLPGRRIVRHEGSRLLPHCV